MKAIVRETYGSPDVLRLADVPLPGVGDDDVLVNVRAASANAGDWHLLRGTPLPFRLVALYFISFIFSGAKTLRSSFINPIIFSAL